MSIQAMKQALEALETVRHQNMSPQIHPAKVALRAAIEAAEKQEPVAWMGEYNINNIRDHYTVVMRHKTDFSSMPDRLRPLYTTPQPAIPAGIFKIDDRVTKIKGSRWTGKVVGTYSTTLTPEGYAVESETEIGSVQIYPAAALEIAPKPKNSHD